MVRCTVDESIERVVIDQMVFPLGVYPVEPMEPKVGYTVEFEPADDGPPDSADEWEQWPDRYVFDIVVPHNRLNALLRHLLAMLPGRVYPILDVLGHDAFREIDPYISYELVGLDRFIDAIRRFRGYFLEDGMVGFGAMSDEPFMYVFVDEHKIVTVRCEPVFRERVEKLLDAFDLQQVDEPVGPDGAAHEHRGVLLMPEDDPDVLGPDEIVEHLRDVWKLTLNVDTESNLDEEGNPLGVTAWRCVVRCLLEGQETPRYSELLLRAGCLREAEELAEQGVEDLLLGPDQEWVDLFVVTAERLTDKQVRQGLSEMGSSRKRPKETPRSDAGVLAARWLTPAPNAARRN